VGRPGPAEGPAFRFRAAVFLLLLAALSWGVTEWRIRSIAASFEPQLSEHVTDDVLHLRREITTIEAELDASADRLEARLTALRAAPPREQFFAMLRTEAAKPGRGARILAGGEPLAWWGEELRASAVRTYQFDATNLYITRTRTAGPWSIETFQRIQNEFGSSSPLHPDDAWIASSMFHGGFLRQEAGARRHLIERRPDSVLWIDLHPRPASEVIERVRDMGHNLAFVLIALAALWSAAASAAALKAVADATALQSALRAHFICPP